MLLSKYRNSQQQPSVLAREPREVQRSKEAASPSHGFFRGKLARAIEDSEDRTRTGFTRKQFQTLSLSGYPVFYDHKESQGRVGHLTRNWVDDEGWLHVEGVVYKGTSLGRAVYDKMMSGELGALSLGWLQEDPSKAPNLERELFKKVREASVTPNPKVKDALIYECHSDESAPLLIFNLMASETNTTSTPTGSPAPAVANSNNAASEKKEEKKRAVEPAAPAEKTPKRTKQPVQEDVDVESDDGGEDDLEKLAEEGAKDPRALIAAHARAAQRAKKLKYARNAEKRRREELESRLGEYETVMKEHEERLKAEEAAYAQEQKPRLEKVSEYAKKKGFDKNPEITELLGKIFSTKNNSSFANLLSSMIDDGVSEAKTAAQLRQELEHARGKSNLLGGALQSQHKQSEQQLKQRGVPSSIRSGAASGEVNPLNVEMPKGYVGGYRMSGDTLVVQNNEESLVQHTSSSKSFDITTLADRFPALANKRSGADFLDLTHKLGLPFNSSVSASRFKAAPADIGEGL